MKGYELLKAISDGEIKNGTKIEIKGRFRGDLEGSYFIYDEGSFVFPIYKPDGTEYYGNVELHDLINFSFEVIEEKKEIEELTDDDIYDFNHVALKVNELVKEVNKINRQLEIQEIEDIDALERQLNKMFKEREEK